MNPTRIPVKVFENLRQLYIEKAIHSFLDNFHSPGFGPLYENGEPNWHFCFLILAQFAECLKHFHLKCQLYWQPAEQGIRRQFLIDFTQSIIFGTVNVFGLPNLGGISANFIPE